MEDADPKCETGQIVTVPLDSLIDGPGKRAVIDQVSLEGLAESIKTCGILQPPGVAQTDDGKYQIVFGHRRVAAARLLGWTEMQVKILPGDNLQVLQVLENLQRQDLPIPEEALSIKNLLEVGNCSQVELAHKLGKEEIYISKQAKLGRLVAKYKETITFTKLRRTVYWELLDTPELLILAEDGCWGQKRARIEATEFIRRKQKEGTTADSPTATPRKRGRRRGYRDLASYQPIVFFEDGFEIKAFRFTRDSGIDIDALMEKMTELQSQTEHIIDFLRHHQSRQVADKSTREHEMIKEAHSALCKAWNELEANEGQKLKH